MLLFKAETQANKHTHTHKLKKILFPVRKNVEKKKTQSFYDSTSCHSWQRKLFMSVVISFIFPPKFMNRIEMIWEWFWFLWIKVMIKNYRQVSISHLSLLDAYDLWHTKIVVCTSLNLQMHCEMYSYLWKSHRYKP